ncbi:Fur family transcriptional regulator [uncultured Sulfitobacter sp.]|uniref:Fur family transcriptional regulator n=1 Tax=uncultured Sulfitobacter sp. TaxID=191468 RepID=UPI0025948803|nr:Fur family transcriptional regulator [uncultured Sulfitobacter sp.]
MSTIGFETHDHGACVDDAMAAAEARCAASDLRLTPIRRRVLELLLAEHRALGAYDILGHLSAEGLGAQPPVAYRALDFLQEQGLVHRIASLNAFIGCPSPEHRHQGHFLICLGCHVAIELEESGISEAIASAAAAHDFVASSETVEVSGLCARCRAAA